MNYQESGIAEILEDLSRKAKSGEIVGIVVAAFHSNEDFHEIVKTEGVPDSKVIGALEIIKAAFIDGYLNLRMSYKFLSRFPLSKSKD